MYFSKVGTTCVEIYGVIITLIGVKVFASWEKASNGRYVEESGFHYYLPKLDGIGGAFSEVHRYDKHILEKEGPLLDSWIRL